jgi:hypothetical protein
MGGAEDMAATTYKARAARFTTAPAPRVAETKLLRTSFCLAAALLPSNFYLLPSNF